MTDDEDRYIARYGKPYKDLPTVTVSVFDDAKCEINRTHQCLESSPAKARFMCHFAACNCDDDELDDDEDLEERGDLSYLEGHVRLYCDDCLNRVLHLPYKVCPGCGVMFKPARTYYAEIVRID